MNHELDAALAILQEANCLFDRWLDFWNARVEPLLRSEDKEIGSLARENIVLQLC
jgi:hypothetical protein